MSKTDLWQKYSRSRDEATKQELVLAYLDLVRQLSGRLAVKLPGCMNREDLESCGILGLLEAIDKFDPGMGISFETFAYRRIQGAMYDEIRKANWIPRTTWQKLNNLYQIREKMEKSLGRSVSDQELAEEMGTTVQEIHKLSSQLSRLTYLSLDDTPAEEEDDTVRFVDMLPDPSSPDPLQVVCEGNDKETLIKAIKLLGERDRLILALYYQEELTLKEIGEVLEVSESRVCQLHRRAIARLRKKLAELSGE